MAGPPEKATPVRNPVKPVWAQRRGARPASPLRAPRPPERALRVPSVFVAPAPSQTWNVLALAELERDLARFLADHSAVLQRIVRSGAVDMRATGVWATGAGTMLGAPAANDAVAWPFSGLRSLGNHSFGFDPARLSDIQQFAALLRDYPFLSGLTLYPAAIVLRADANPYAAVIQRAVQQVLGGQAVNANVPVVATGGLPGEDGALHGVITAYREIRERAIRNDSPALRDLDLLARQAAELFVAEAGHFLAQARFERVAGRVVSNELGRWQELWNGVADDLLRWSQTVARDVRQAAAFNGVIETLYYFARQQGFQRSAAVLGRALAERQVGGEAAYLEPLALLAAMSDALQAGNVEAVSEAALVYRAAEQRLTERTDRAAEDVRAQLGRLLERRRQTPVTVATLLRSGAGLQLALGVGGTVSLTEDYRAANELERHQQLAAQRVGMLPLPAAQMALADLDAVLRSPRPLQLLEAYVVLRERRAVATLSPTPGTPAPLPAGFSSGSDLFHRRFQALLTQLKDFVAPAKASARRAADEYIEAVRNGALDLARSALGPLARLFEAHGDTLDGQVVTIAELQALAGDDELLKGAVLALENLLRPILNPLAAA